MKVIFDADSLIYACCFVSASKRQSADDLFETDLDVAYESFKSKLETYLEFIEKTVTVDELVVCNGSINNFRKSITDTYKANRTSERPPLLGALHNLIKFEYDSVWADGVETDDVVATLWADEVKNNGVNNVIIMALDKDYKQFPCWFYDYNYKNRNLSKITELEALNNFYSQMIIGDTADNIKVCKGYGKVYASKLFKESKNEYSLRSKTYRLYKKVYGDDARKEYEQAKALLTLKTDCNENIVKY